MKIMLGVALILVSAGAGMGQIRTQIAEIDAYVATVKKVSSSKRQQKIVIADTADYEQQKSKWQRFASEKALEKYRNDKTETYSIAYNWKKGGKLVESNFTDFSPSGDWSLYTFHYFRPDGSTAKVESELRTFYGDYIAIRNYYFNEKGKIIKQTSKYLDLNTNKPKKPNKEMMDPSSFAPKLFTSVDKLPFADLLK